jgi:DNA-binding NarL/FixJ family response regulator
MRYPQVVVLESDGRLAALLRPLAEQRRWPLREPRRADACLRLLARGGPAVVVIRAGRDLEGEFGLLEQVRRHSPEARCVVLSDPDHPRLAGLAWDLGADCVLAPSQARDLLPDVVVGLMGAPDKD